MDNYKKVYDTRDITALTPMMWPTDKQVFNPYTEVEPPAGDNIKIVGFNFNTESWQYMQVATPSDVAAQDQKSVDIMVAVTELYEQQLTINNRLDKLEGK